MALHHCWRRRTGGVGGLLRAGAASVASTPPETFLQGHHTLGGKQGHHTLGRKHVIRPPNNERSPRRLRRLGLRRKETEAERERRIESQSGRERGRLLGERDNEIKTLREGGRLSVRYPRAEGASEQD